MLNRTVQKGAMTVVQTIDNESPKQMISAKRNQLKLIPFQERSGAMMKNSENEPPTFDSECPQRA